MTPILFSRICILLYLVGFAAMYGVLLKEYFLAKNLDHPRIKGPQ